MVKMTFHPGETLVLNFRVPFSIYDVDAVVLSFRGKKGVVFETIATSFKEEEEYITRVGYTLTQSETLQFEEFTDYKMQLNVYGPNSSRIATKEIDVRTESQHMIEPGVSNIISPVDIINSSSGSSSSTITEIVSYNDLIDKPLINNKILAGNRNLPDTAISNELIDQITSQL